VLLGDCVASTGAEMAGLAVPAADDIPIDIIDTDDTAATLGDVQYASGAGPALDAAAGEPVLVADLADPLAGDLARWPAFREHALASGVRAVFTFPVLVGDALLATLSLYRRSPGTLGEAELQAARTAVESLGVLLLDADASFTDAGERADLALLVHRAAGHVMVELDTSVRTALLLMRTAASEEGVPVHRVARDVLDGGRRFGSGDT
jgi:GAF domain